ncbi:hypothetical protein P7H20_21490 [Paenibacillus larvae]|nr:hypothetical protein [Paenibacillus larvae]MDT2276888.1 hypothetical protein [Paenibacillus larvae]
MGKRFYPGMRCLNELSRNVEAALFATVVGVMMAISAAWMLLLSAGKI